MRRKKMYLPLKLDLFRGEQRYESQWNENTALAEQSKTCVQTSKRFSHPNKPIGKQQAHSKRAHKDKRATKKMSLNIYQNPRRKICLSSSCYKSGILSLVLQKIVQSFPKRIHLPSPVKQQTRIKLLY